MRHAIVAGFFAAAVLAAPVASATTYTSSAAFAADVSGLMTEDFGSYAAGTVIADGSTLGDLTYTFNTAAGRGGIITDIFNNVSGRSLAANRGASGLGVNDFFFPGEGFTITLPFAVRAIGFLVNISVPSSAAVTTSAGDAAADYVSWDSSSFIFLGFTSPTAFTSATFSVPVDASSGYNVAAISYGPPVPEPQTWALMIAGFAGLGSALRLRRQAIA